MRLKIARSVASTSNDSQAVFDLLPEGCAQRQYLHWACETYGSPPIYHLACILALTAYELERRGFYLSRTTDGGRLPLTLWFCMVGESGTGKSTAINSVQDFMRDAWDEGNQLFPDPWLEPDGSVQGIVAALQDFYNKQHGTTACLMYHHEVAQVFNTRESIAEQLCKISDGRTFQANYRRNQHAKAKDPNADRVVNPRVSFLAATTEAQLAPYFKDQHRSGGIFTRLTWLKPDFEKEDVRMSQDYEGARSLGTLRTEAVDSMVNWFAQLSLLEHSEGKAFRFSKRGHNHLERRLFRPFSDQFEAGSNDNMHGVRMRLVEKARVMATLQAAIRGSMVIEPCDVEPAVQLVWRLLEHTKRMSHFGSGELYRHVMRVESMVKGAGEKGLYRKVVYAKLRVDKQIMDKIFDTLADAGRVFIDWKHETRPGVYVHTDTEAGRRADTAAADRQQTREEVLAAQRRHFQN